MNTLFPCPSNQQSQVRPSKPGRPRIRPVQIAPHCQCQACSSNSQTPAPRYLPHAMFPPAFGTSIRLSIFPGCAHQIESACTPGINPPSTIICCPDPSSGLNSNVVTPPRLISSRAFHGQIRCTSPQSRAPGPSVVFVSACGCRSPSRSNGVDGSFVVRIPLGNLRFAFALSLRDGLSSFSAP